MILHENVVCGCDPVCYMSKKCEIFQKCLRLLQILSSFCYTSPQRDNQVGDLSHALHLGLGELAFVGVWRLYMIQHAKMFMRLTIYDSL